MKLYVVSSHNDVPLDQNSNKEGNQEFSSSLIGLTFIDCMIFMIVTFLQEIPVLFVSIFR